MKHPFVAEVGFEASTRSICVLDEFDLKFDEFDDIDSVVRTDSVIELISGSTKFNRVSMYKLINKLIICKLYKFMEK